MSFKPTSLFGRLALANSRGKQRKQARYLAHAFLLEESGPPHLVSSLLALISLLVGGFIVWAAITKIDEKAVTLGEVLPVGQVRYIQHLEGGIVRSIRVAEGDMVQAGQTLMVLDPTASQSELDQLQGREAVLALEVERLRVFAMDKQADFSDYENRYPELVADQRAILDLQVAARKSQRDVLEKQIAERKAEINVLQKQRSTTGRQVKLVAEELEMRETLLKKGLVSRIVFLETQRALNLAQGDLSAVIGRLTQAAAALGESHFRLIELDTKLRSDAVKAMGKVSGELIEARAAVAKLSDRVSRHKIVSPVHGVVKDLNIHTLGGVVVPGAGIMEIVPIDDELVVEARISPGDVGHVVAGQDVSVKVLGYDFARYGDIKGKLHRVSASTTADEQGERYYKGVIRLASNHLGRVPGENLVLPGMNVQADILTGQRTVLQYLLKPIYRAMDTAFAER